MKLASTIFTYIGAVLTTIYALINLIGGTVILTTQCTSYGCNLVLVRQPSPSWLWIFFVIGIILRVIILVWRHHSIKNGKKVACGVCTLLFVSLVGGILTLCIPEEDLY